MAYSTYIKPFWVRQCAQQLPDNPIILDFGCANDSARLTKRWFGCCVYHGADITYDSNDPLVDVFHKLNPVDDLLGIPAEAFDLVLMKHVIEHLQDPLGTLRALTSKIKAGGLIYLAFPHPRSVTFPSAQGTLNFYDDATHIWLPSIEAVLATLRDCGITVIRSGTTRSLDKVVLGVPLLLLNLFRARLGLQLKAKGLWDLYGFEFHIIGQRASG